MRLKRLELVGFKSFADATELVFDDGITAIIGPNGCGKSNCADALLWVLAERRLSALRAGEGTDVIFAGSGQRRPVGFAEVTLTIDNADRTLPLDLAEVNVSRRVHRDGETEYRLNHRRCRRKDVIDLFLDTGVGRQSFSVISQREVDAILSLDPQDRRRMIEEVAGIERYRARRDETMQRLTDTATNLTRLGDVMLGLELQVEPLAEQRERAQHFLALRGRAARLKLSLLAKDYQLLARRVLRSDEELDQLRAAVTAAQTGLAQAEAAEQAGRLDLLQADEKLTAERRVLSEAAQAGERLEADIRVGDERLNNLTVRLDEATTGQQRSAAALVELDVALAARSDELAAVETELAAARTALHDLVAAGTATREREAGREAELVAQRAALQEVTSRIHALDARHGAASQSLAAATQRQDSLATRQQEALAAVAAAAAQAEAAAATVTAAQAAAGAAVEAERHAAAALDDAERQRRAVRDRIGDRQSRLAEQQTRLRLLREALEAYDGLYRGVKAVLQARDRGRLGGDYQVVADVLQVADGCEAAIEAALGPRLQDLICDTAEDARAGIEYLKQDRAGRATFLPLDLLAVPAPLRQVERLRAMPGVVGWALDLVTCDVAWDRARRQLLGQVVVVETMEAAVAVRRAGFDHVTIVSLDGDLLRTSGAMTGGAAEQRGPALLTRRREAESLAAVASRTEAELAAARQTEQELQVARQAVEAELATARRTVETHRRELAAAERAQVQAAGRLALATTEGERWAQAAAAIAADSQTATATLDEVAAELSTLRARAAELGPQVTAAEADLSAARAARAAEAEALAARQVALARAESRHQALLDARAGQQRARQLAADELARLRRAADVWARDRQTLETELVRLRHEWGEQRAARLERDEALAALTAMRQDAQEAVAAAQRTARQARQDLADAQEGLHRAELRRIQVDTELAHLRHTLAEDHDGLTPEQAAAQAEEVPNRQEAADTLAALRAEMDLMGEVNLGAIEEYDRVTERLLFYERQRADLEQARSDLLLVMGEIDDVTQVRLAEAFAAVNREFATLFRRVFGGDGEARLEWTEPERILDSGVDVFVRLPGKRVQSIVLLSGGERAMCSITLLLAMFRVKPSPFCLLDELDAPLDEANLRKYVQLLREFSDHSQFIVITHNPETTRAADTLYGITMPEPGVSRAYSYRPPAETAPDAALAAAG